MFEPKKGKIMIDLHGLKVKEVKEVLATQFAQLEQSQLGELYLITGYGKHLNADQARGVLKKLLPKLLAPYCEHIQCINKEAGAYKIILKKDNSLFPSFQEKITRLFTHQETRELLMEHRVELEARVNNNDTHAMVILGELHVYMSQEIGDVFNMQTGLELLESAKRRGSLDAYVKLGILYLCQHLTFIEPIDFEAPSVNGSVGNSTSNGATSIDFSSSADDYTEFSSFQDAEDFNGTSIQFTCIYHR